MINVVERWKVVFTHLDGPGQAGFHWTYLQRVSNRQTWPSLLLWLYRAACRLSRPGLTL